MLDTIFPGCETLEVAEAADVARAVESACAERRPLYPVGGGTALGLGAAVEQPGTILPLSKLDQIVDYPSRDLTITVEAGTTMARLAACLAAENQRLPVDVPEAEAATVGGAIAANLSGPRRHRFGTMRDYVLGLSMVDGTGTPFSTGGRVVKNAAGYDLTRLMIGSLGTLGIMTQVTLMVRPQPEASALVAIPLPALDKADALLESLLSSHVAPAAIELTVGDRLPDPLSAHGRVTLWIGFEGDELDVRWMLDSTVQLCRKQELEVTAIDEPQPVESIWRALARAPSAASDPSEPLLGIEVTVMPSQTISVAKGLRGIADDATLSCRAGDGVLLASYACTPAEAGELAGRVREVAVEKGGKAVVVTYPPQSCLTPTDVWGARGSESRVVEQIKGKFDPEDILNRGRFIFPCQAATSDP